MSGSDFWKAKIAAFLHDPLEKAFVLMRGESHERIADEAAREIFGEELLELRDQTKGLKDAIKRADWFASGADRPNLPRDFGGAPFWDKPEIVHPLTGKAIRLGEDLLGDFSKDEFKRMSAAHLARLANSFRENSEGGDHDWRAAFFALWRYGDEVSVGESSDKNKPKPNLWRVSPADSRTPDHGILEHLSLASAFTGASLSGKRPALLLVSFGPVQGFIAEARKMNDLWAGSHLLSAITFSAIWEVARRYGPDAVLFPQLRGVAIVDEWMRREIFGGKLPDGAPEDEEFQEKLLSAAFPNRFVALVPADEAEEAAKAAIEAARAFVWDQAGRMLAEIEGIVGPGDAGAKAARKQAKAQLEGFPEAYWACVDWEAVIKDGSEQGELDWGKIDELMQALGGGEYIHGALREKREGVYTPKAGAAFPGLFEAVERAHAAAKSARAFAQKPQQGYRCTICGEREWIGGDEIIEVEKISGEAEEEAAKLQPTRRLPEKAKPENLWHQIHRQAPMLAKNGEHLCAWCSLKRFWPRLLADWLFGEDEERKKSFSVPMVSTHAMALAPSIERWAELPPDPRQKEAVRKLVDKLAATEGAKRGAWLPSRTAAEVIRKEAWLGEVYRDEIPDTKPREFARRLPALLDALTEKADDDEEDRQVKIVRGWVEQALGGRMERYYALVLMDGDRMGKWLAGEMAAERVGRDGKEEYLLPMRSRLRGDLRDDPQVEEHSDYWDAPRPVSPAWHQAISGALNSFSAELARVVVEEMFTGKLIYAGGDDLLAMVCVRDLPAVMLALRCLYSGVLPAGYDDESKRFFTDLGARIPDAIKLGQGFALYRGRLHRMMGEHATASIGAVVAHHTAPLARVLRDLRAAEKRAKDMGRDAFAITVGKRAGGAMTFAGKWRLADEDRGDLGLLYETAKLLGGDVSRRAAYAIVEELPFVPPLSDSLESVLRLHFGRKARAAGLDHDLVKNLAGRAAQATKPTEWLREMFVAAEFLGREGRIGANGRAQAKKEAA